MYEKENKRGSKSGIKITKKKHEGYCYNYKFFFCGICTKLLKEKQKKTLSSCLFVFGFEQNEKKRFPSSSLETNKQ